MYYLQHRGQSWPRPWLPAKISKRRKLKLTFHRNTDVTGKPKGQGQEKEVIHNRDKKEKHKSARANHNRRQGAQYKRSQGMMPS